MWRLIGLFPKVCFVEQSTSHFHSCVYLIFTVTISNHCLIFKSTGLALKQCLVVQELHHLVPISVLNVQQRTLHGWREIMAAQLLVFLSVCVKGIVILTRIARLGSSGKWPCFIPKLIVLFHSSLIIIFRHSMKYIVNNVQALKQSLDVSEFLNPVRTTAGILN